MTVYHGYHSIFYCTRTVVLRAEERATATVCISTLDRTQGTLLYYSKNLEIQLDSGAAIKQQTLLVARNNDIDMPTGTQALHTT